MREPFRPERATPDVTTDAEIIRRSLEHPRAFSVLFDRHARDVGRFALRGVGADAADDVVSETFLTAFRRRSSFDQSREDARPWLLGIAANLVKKHRGAEAAQWRAYGAAVAVHEEGVEDGFQAAADRADADATLRALAPAIAKLAARDRQTLLLHAWGDLTYEEIGQALGVPTGTVRSRLNRVRRTLTKAAGPAGITEGGVDGRHRSGSPVR
jgi:RNA polymerase sigma factor (sigma-70 family)